MQGSRITDEQLRYIKKNYRHNTPEKIAQDLCLSEQCIRSYLRKLELPAYKVEWTEQMKHLLAMLSKSGMRLKKLAREFGTTTNKIAEQLSILKQEGLL